MCTVTVDPVTQRSPARSISQRHVIDVVPMRSGQIRTSTSSSKCGKAWYSASTRRRGKLQLRSKAEVSQQQAVPGVLGVAKSRRWVDRAAGVGGEPRDPAALDVLGKASPAAQPRAASSRNARATQIAIIFLR